MKTIAFAQLGQLGTRHSIEDADMAAVGVDAVTRIDEPQVVALDHGFRAGALRRFELLVVLDDADPEHRRQDQQTRTEQGEIGEGPFIERAQRDLRIRSASLPWVDVSFKMDTH